MFDRDVKEGMRRVEEIIRELGGQVEDEGWTVDVVTELANRYRLQFFVAGRRKPVLFSEGELTSWGTPETWKKVEDRLREELKPETPPKREIGFKRG